MRFQLSALQFGKEFLEVKGKAEQEQFRRDVRLSAHEKASELTVAFENTKSALYLNRAVHPQKSTTFRGKTLKSHFPVISGFSAHPDFFVFLRISRLEALAVERTAGTILTAVIVRGGNKAGFFP